MSHTILDGIGWGLFRGDRQDDALLIFRRNRAAFPELYVPNESLAEALVQAGRTAEGLAILEGWVDEHPDDDRARRVLLNLRSRAG